MKDHIKNQNDGARVRFTMLIVIITAATFTMLSGLLAAYAGQREEDTSYVAEFEYDDVDQPDIPLANPEESREPETTPGAGSGGNKDIEILPDREKHPLTDGENGENNGSPDEPEGGENNGSPDEPEGGENNGSPNEPDGGKSPPDKIDTQEIDLFATTDTAFEGVGERLIAPGAAGRFEIHIINKSTAAIKPGIQLFEKNAGGVPIVYGFKGMYFSSAAPVNGKVGNRRITGDLAGMKNIFDAVVPVVPAGAPVYSVPITWEWAFKAGDAQTNEKDTQLGLRGTDVVLLTVECSMTQAS